ncbi:MAG: c-type cytochrome [Planctomycetes bacterium]|nr:c-type cytochrome [Planctomycetota bacterium]
MTFKTAPAAALCLLAAPAWADGPLPPEDAARTLEVPDGFRAALFAGEPDVTQPIGFAFDDRGRLWCVECKTYPSWTREPRGEDKVLIFEDRDGDGRADSRKVFLEGAANLSGIEVGFGGAWLCATPRLLFVPDRDGDGAPDGPPETVIDGWSFDVKHNVFNGLAWGPDGWLYGLHGILATSMVGPPGASEAQRTPINCGVWRWHPARRAFEVVAHGTTNPWGMDFDERGECFITNCVIEHVFHVVPGAHFVRMYGQDFDPHLYRLMTSPADHIHWAGGPWQESRSGQAHRDAGGGHAHTGAMIYQAGAWPERYRGGLFTCNIHGQRVNHDRLERRGSGFVARHERDFCQSWDPFFRGLGIQQGPGGSAFVTDWSDDGECHDYDEVHRESGRIFKLSFGAARPAALPDFARLPDAELVRLQRDRDEWLVRHARRILQERAAAGRLEVGTRRALLDALRREEGQHGGLRLLWALHATGGADEALFLELLGSPHESVRAWAIRLELEDREASPRFLARLAELARSDPSGLVRLHIASALQRLPLEARWPIAGALSARAEDAGDSNLALLLWYGAKDLVPAEPLRAAGLAAGARIPLLREHIARRIASLEGAAIAPASIAIALDALAAAVLDSSDAALGLGDVVRGLHEALKGRREARAPARWAEVLRRLEAGGTAEAREKALALTVVFGDPTALAALRATVTDASAGDGTRARAAEALARRRDPELLPALLGLLRRGELRGAAIRALAAYDAAEVPRAVLEAYAAFSDAEKLDAVITLASRPAFALALLDAVARGRVPRRDVSAFAARQMAGLGSDDVRRALAEVWGEVRAAGEDKGARLSRWKAALSPEALAAADPRRGRAVFQRTCAPCHRLSGEGRAVGPDLTGSQRANLDYVLENLLDPDAVIGRDYQATTVVTLDGRVATGVVAEESDGAVTLLTANETLVVPKEDIAAREVSAASMMPADLLERMPVDEVRDLVTYLREGGQ